MGGWLGAGLCAPRRPGSWEPLKIPFRRACSLSGVGDFQGVGWIGQIVSQRKGKQLVRSQLPWAWGLVKDHAEGAGRRAGRKSGEAGRGQVCDGS